MRRFVASSLAVALALAPAPVRQARGQAAVACVNCASQINQLVEMARQAQQLSEAITMRIAQANMLRYQIQNMASLPGQVWHNIEANFNATRSLFDRGSQLALNAGMVSSQLQSYRSYLGQVIEMPSQYQRWSMQANDSVTASLAGLGLQRDQMSTDRQIVDAIRARSAGADGAVRAIQANTEMGSAQVNELHRLREIMLADAQLNANTLQMQADRAAVGQALHDQFLYAPRAAMTGNQRY